MTSVEDDFALVTSAVWKTTVKQIINVNDNFAPMISVNDNFALMISVNDNYAPMISVNDNCAPMISRNDNFSLCERRLSIETVLLGYRGHVREGV